VKNNNGMDLPKAMAGTPLSLSAGVSGNSWNCAKVFFSFAFGYKKVVK